MKQVIVYNLDYCPYCKRAKTLLRERNISFKEIDVSRNEEKYSEKLEKKYDRHLSKQRSMGNLVI